MAPESSRKRLPFEPGGKKAAGKVDAAGQKPAQSAQKRDRAAAPRAAGTVKADAKPKGTSSKATAQKATAIPEEVSQRMLRRMLVFSGTPTALAIVTFFVSYYLVVNQVVELPSYFVLLVTLGLFGLGVVGLTYGVLSASWDEGRPGSRLGLEEFQVNFGRMTSAWGQRSER